MDKTKLAKFLKGLLKVTIFISLASLALVALFIYAVLALLAHAPVGTQLGYSGFSPTRWWYARSRWGNFWEN